MERLTYYIDKKVVTVFVEYTKNKNMYLRIKKKQIYCSAPFYTTDSLIKTFVDKHIKRFSEELKKMENNDKYSLIYDFLYFKGRKYFYQRLAGFHTSLIEIYNNKMYIKTPTSNNAEVKMVIKKFLIAELQTYLETALYDWTKKMKLPTHVFEIMGRKSIWGLNVTNKNIVKFNYYLSHFKPEVTDYLIVHELAHTYEPNHSKNFWNIVKKYFPNYKDVKLSLKNNSDLNDL